MPANPLLILKHLWLDESDARRMLGKDAFDRITQKVAISEHQHLGEIRVCVEASLPLSYLWRVGKEVTLRQVIRERALMMFSKLRVWDTERNNGVLIYLLMAEHDIEIVADRGLNAQVPEAVWQELVSEMGELFRKQRYEEGIGIALDQISARLVRHFQTDETSASLNTNELPDEPSVL